jgi:hypothetical protein
MVSSMSETIETPSSGKSCDHAEKRRSSPRGITTSSSTHGGVPSPTAAAEMGEAPADLIQRAIADLVLRTGATDANIKVVSAMAVTWNDGSLGCPTPGEVYLQVLVEGYQIQLSYQGNTYDYHASAKAVFLCENGLQMQAGSPENLSPTLRLVTLAMQDLALRLSISTSQIVAQPVIPTVWPDTSLGCPEAGQAYAAVETPGYQIRLDAGGRVYTYHSDLERVVFCTSP